MDEDHDQAVQLDPNEMLESLNGFEEIAIESMFTRSVAQLARAAEEGTVFPLMRSLLFIEAKRDGMSHHEAFKRVMDMRLIDVVMRFREPATDEGKDSAPNETRPMPDSLSAPGSLSPWMSSSR